MIVVPLLKGRQLTNFGKTFLCISMRWDKWNYIAVSLQSVQTANIWMIVIATFNCNRAIVNQSCHAGHQNIVATNTFFNGMCYTLYVYVVDDVIGGWRLWTTNWSGTLIIQIPSRETQTICLFWAGHWWGKYNTNDYIQLDGLHNAPILIFFFCTIGNFSDHYWCMNEKRYRSPTMNSWTLLPGSM